MKSKKKLVKIKLIISNIPKIFLTKIIIYLLKLKLIVLSIKARLKALPAAKHAE